jgi:hypothetical protein
LLLIGRKIVVDWAVPQLEKGNRAATLLQVKEEPEENTETEPVEKSSHIKTGKKLNVPITEAVENIVTKESKKMKKAKKGRLIVRNLPFKVRVTESINILTFLLNL